MAAAAATSTAAQPADPPEQFYCSAEASGEDGALVYVALYVEPDGRIVGTFADWTPPHDGPRPDDADGQPEFDLRVAYHEASADGVGVPATPTVQMQLLDTAATVDELSGRWAGLTVEARSADNVASYPLVRPTYALDLIGWLVLEAPLEMLGSEYAGKVRIAVTDAAGHPVAAFESDLSKTAQRNQLFRKAYHEAARKARAPEACDPTSSEVDA
ncbi:hypothetical protein [Parerythrobacter lacustris]|uniref:Uncharacterized protein n=1 Tax=Parerythrobacter lacustris TaxID=2969984 RepID=A0ABT1XU87_9SPHN|nr:hypothetical protein [Parerythrobacter lacustris]MCR2834787.1 hypothetical protein [Parerythrobacter lacustris]